MKGACWGQRANLRLPTAALHLDPGLRTVQGTLQPRKESEAKQRLAWPGSASMCQSGGSRATLSPARLYESCLLGGGTCITRAEEGL